MKFALCVLVLLAQTTFAGLEKYSSLVVADANPNTSAPVNGIRITYLGVNGFQFEADGHALLVDPYFTRVNLWAAALNERIEPNPNRISEGLRHVRRKVDALLVTHAHFDHLLDVPEIMRRTHPRLVAGPTAARLAESFGIPPNECITVKPGNIRTIGPWTIRVLAAEHDRLFGKVPFAGRSGLSRPIKASDWVVGESLAFVIEAGGKRVYIDSGGVPGSAPPDSPVKNVDLAILGVALPDSRDRFAQTVRRLRPRYIFPSHQDDMFTPADRGFIFGKMTNFPSLVREQKEENLPGRLILLDYFRPWTLR